MPCGGPGIDLGHAGAGLVEAGEDRRISPRPWSRRGGSGTRLRASPSAWRCFPVQPPARGRRGSTTRPGRSARSPGDPRARHLTREIVGRPASTSLNPRARLLGVRARGLSDDLADRAALPGANEHADTGTRTRTDAGRNQGGRGPSRAGPGLRNASPAQHDPPQFAPCEPGATKSTCARSARARLAQCELRRHHRIDFPRGGDAPFDVELK